MFFFSFIVIDVLFSSIGVDQWIKNILHVHFLSEELFSFQNYYYLFTIIKLLLLVFRF